MGVPMMSIWEMDVRVHNRCVAVPVGVTDTGRDGVGVIVLVVFIVHMGMRMFERLMTVFVFMSLCQMQPHTQTHQESGHEQWDRHRVAHQHGEYRTEERCHREIGAGASRTEMP